MKSKRIAFIAKTDINTDGRILNQISVLLQRFNNISIEFIILPDKPILITSQERVNFYEINCAFRNNSFFRIFTVLEFTLKALIRLFKIKPDVLHVQDSAGSLPALLYKFIKDSTLVIYDDHEIPNENATLYEKLNFVIENSLLKRSEYLIEANDERLEYICSKLELTDIVSTTFLNLPFELDNFSDTYIPEEICDKLELLNTAKNAGYKLIVHQGPLKYERGRELIAEFIKRIPDNYRLFFLGGSINDYDKFLNEFQLTNEKLIFIGSVNYKYLNLFWDYASLSLIIYLPNYMNNKLCAPNRYYLSLKNDIPTIVNASNPVLKNLVEKYRNGFYLEEILRSSFPSLEDVKSKQDIFNFEDLENDQIHVFTSFYNNVLNAT